MQGDSNRLDGSACRFLIEALCRGVRAEARRQRCSPLDSRWPQYGRWLAELHRGEALVIAVARDARIRVEACDGVAVLRPPDHGAMRCPSRAASIYLTRLVERWCEIVPPVGAVARAMELLAADATREAA